MFPYILEIAMVILYPVLLGITLANAGGASTIGADYDFIVNAALAGVTLVCVCVCWGGGA